MAQLKLMALDAEDLEVISSCCQDAVLAMGEMEYLPGENRFVMAINRYAWEQDRGGSRDRERHKAVLQFARVNSVRTLGIDRHEEGMILSLLAILFEPGDAPAGSIELVFAGDGAIRLDVECVEVQLADLDAAWEAQSRPSHE